MVDIQFGNWLAGFIDGEGCFYIQAARRTRSDGSTYYYYRPIFSLSIRHDDDEIIKEIVKKTEIGSTHYYMPSGPGKKVFRWMVQAKPHTQELCRLLDMYPLRAKKKNDYLLWKQAVAISSEIKKGCKAYDQPAYLRLAEIKLEISNGRKITE